MSGESTATAGSSSPEASARGTIESGAGAARRRVGPLPLRPRGGFGSYLHELRRERGLTVREVATRAGVHHTYVSKLERGDRQAPDDAVVEALATAVDATPAQLDQLRWRAGVTPRGAGAPGHDDPTVTLLAEALGDPSLATAERDRLRRSVAQTVAQVVEAVASKGQSPRGKGQDVRPQKGYGQAGTWGPGGASVATPPRVSASPEPAPDARATLLAGLLGGWQTLDEAAAELRVAPPYLWELVQSGQLRAWALPGAPAGSPAGVRLRREDVLGLLQPVATTPAGR